MKSIRVDLKFKSFAFLSINVQLFFKLEYYLFYVITITLLLFVGNYPCRELLTYSKIE